MASCSASRLATGLSLANSSLMSLKPSQNASISSRDAPPPLSSPQPVPTSNPAIARPATSRPIAPLCPLILPELSPRHGHAMHLVGAVGQAQGTDVRVH